MNSILTVLAAVIILGEVEFSGDDESSQVSDNSSKHITNLAKLLGVKEGKAFPQRYNEMCIVALHKADGYEVQTCKVIN